MPDRLRALAAAPIPGRRARLILLGCVALVLALAAAALLDRGHSHAHAAKVPASPIVLEAINPPATPSVPSTSSRTRSRRRIASQDPQAHRGTPAARRAARTSAAHRALQHVPYQHDGVSIRLTGARPDGEAILSVTAPTIRRARAGYRDFLARYHDAGRAYAPRFHATGSGVRARG